MDLFEEVDKAIAGLDKDVAEIERKFPENSKHKLINEFHELASTVKGMKSECGVEKNNGHYRVCAWSNENACCGPDTCVCVRVGMLERRLQNVMHNLKIFPANDGVE